jgi:hypothetical protein
MAMVGKYDVIKTGLRVQWNYPKAFFETLTEGMELYN